MDGRLSLVAEFPDRDPVVLSGISEDEPDPKPSGKKRTLASRSAWKTTYARNRPAPEAPLSTSS